MPIEGVGRGMRPLFRSLAIPASGLSAQRQRIEAIAQNIANADATRTADGTPYRRKVVQMEAQPFTPDGSAVAGGATGGVRVTGVEVPFAPRVDVPEAPIPGLVPGLEAAEGGVRVAGVAEDASEGPLVYDPGHPDADESGYVRYPNVRITDEMIDLMDARRVYEANATVFQAVKAMLRRAVEI